MQQSYEGSADSVVIMRSIATAAVLAFEYLSVAGRWLCSPCQSAVVENLTVTLQTFGHQITS